MGEAKRKSRKRAEILAGEQRCIYCVKKPESVEHMPPLSMFKRGARPSGLEFASCQNCNRISRASDAAASFLARMEPEHTIERSTLERSRQLISTLTQIAPIFVQELFNPSKEETVWAKGRSSVLGRMHRLTLDGVATTALMQAFGAKMAMALFREYVGVPLPAHGQMYVQHYFNAGLYRKETEATLSILPTLGQLEQGRKKSGKVFNYRYNTDEKTILAAFCAFRDNLFFRIFAVSDPVFFAPLESAHQHPAVKVGELEKLAVNWSPEA